MKTKVTNTRLMIAVLTTMFLIGIGILNQCKAQSRVGFQASLDGKMLAIGDDARHIKEGTIDLSARFIMQGNQKRQQMGYVIVFPEFTYRNTVGNLKSYSANVGYVWNKLIIPKSEVSLTAGYGWIDHYGKTNFSFRGSLGYALKLNDNLKIVAVGDMVQRSDLKRLYPKADNKTFKPSLRFGIEIGL